ncbi:MAG TPA: TraR/DksA family transcriptional regulator [Terriglobales bacterium]|nr:TraR/DksA family transcriptional regulator [Terriglobales bacterium]
MAKKRLQQFGERLEIRHKELRRSVIQKQQSARTIDDALAPDVIDRAASTYTKDFLFRQSTNERHLLEMVEESLRRVRDGSFGLCLSCGNEINSKRLEAVPWTRYCIACQERIERAS